MALSDRQMLLLDNLMYGDFLQGNEGLTVRLLLQQFTDKSGKISEELVRNAVNSNQLHLSGGFETDVGNYCEVLRKISEDSKLMSLRVAKTTPEYHGSIRAACFEDYDGDATVAFRGTGGSFEQWYNNLEGYGDESQQSQRDAKAFIDSLDYDHVDVTGHSNGGNQAMYVAIVCGDKVRRCLSFEGQGFSDEFLLSHLGQISKNKHKIRNICGSHDKVGALMTSVAGETRYVKSTSDKKLGHGSYGILEAADDNEGFDADGNFRSDYKEKPARGVLVTHYFTMAMAKLSKVPGLGRVLELFTDLAGIGAGLFFDRDKFFSLNFIESGKAWFGLFKKLGAAILDDLFPEIKRFKNILKKGYEQLKVIYKGLGNWLKKHFNAGYKYANANPEIKVDTYLLRTYSDRLRKLNSRLSALDQRLHSLYSKVGIANLLDLMKSDMVIGSSRKISKCANYLSSTADIFDSAEKEILDKVL